LCDGDYGQMSTNYYRTIYRYDDLGRRHVEIEVVSGTSVSDGVEQVTQTVYDKLGRVVEVRKGVSDASHNMGPNYDNLPTMVLFSRTGRGTGSGR